MPGGRRPRRPQRGWTVGTAALTFPLYAWTLDDPELHLGGGTLGGVPAALAAVVAGIALLAVLPGLVRLLARADAFLVRTLLR